MDLSPTHIAAREAACRLPALAASLALLEVENPSRAHIDFYGTTRPAAGGDPGGSPVVSVNVAATAGSVNDSEFQIELTVPIEDTITGAEPSGTTLTWARIVDGNGDWWADLSVCEPPPEGEAPTGEIVVATLLALNGAAIRVSSAVFPG